DTHTTDRRPCSAHDVTNELIPLKPECLVPRSRYIQKCAQFVHVKYDFEPTGEMDDIAIQIPPGDAMDVGVFMYQLHLKPFDYKYDCLPRYLDQIVKHNHCMQSSMVFSKALLYYAPYEPKGANELPDYIRIRSMIGKCVDEYWWKGNDMMKKFDPFISYEWRVRGGQQSQVRQRDVLPARRGHRA
ncbi:unnamed protein product, partial [Prorocentrum cordatum]